ncbi:uncharacterized protein LOC141632515 [Silene latifolia]|uniref:uncharacterized protein LOC141632515 n=1 Tax=Silene latifolia TaxID=37657 RepID=UPI003D77F66C
MIASGSLDLFSRKLTPFLLRLTILSVFGDQQTVLACLYSCIFSLMLIFPYLVFCAGLCPLPLSPDKTASLSKLFSPPPENRTFPNLIQDSAAAVKKTVAEEKDSMSTSSAKSRISLQDVLAQRVQEQVASVPKPAEKRKSTPAPGSGPRPKRRSAAAERAKEQTPIEATPLAVRPPLPGHGLSASGDALISKAVPGSAPAKPASGATPTSGATPLSELSSLQCAARFQNALASGSLFGSKIAPLSGSLRFQICFCLQRYSPFVS